MTETRSGAGRRVSSLVVLGAGPKAVALAARAHVMRSLGFTVPEITAIEPIGVGANWTSRGGRTTGRQLLGNTPEKDIGFPYETEGAGVAGPRIDAELQRFGWTAYLISRGDYAEWIDRGRPQPRHADFARYLGWVADQVGMTVLPGRVTSASIVDDRWMVEVTGTDGSPEQLLPDALMITGPGQATSGLGNGVVTEAQEFFRGQFAVPDGQVEVAVIGGGETAASITDELISSGVEKVTIISPEPAIYSRGEGFIENLLFTRPEEWRVLPGEKRREFIKRVDLGVFSTSSLSKLSGSLGVSHRRGRVVDCRQAPEGIAVSIVDDCGTRTVRTYDVVIDGAVPDRRGWMLDLFPAGTVERLAEAVGCPAPRGPRGGDHRGLVSAVEEHIADDMSVRGLRPILYAPMLAAYAQGPGFPNLSCLGRLTDRILSPLAGLGDDADAAAPASAVARSAGV